MIRQCLFASVFALAVSTVQAQTAPAKVGTINIQAAIVGTKEGQKAAQELEAKFLPRRKVLDGKQAEIQGMRDRMSKISNTASAEERDRLARDIDTRTKAYNRDIEDAQAESEQEQGRVLNDLGGRMMQVIDKYAVEKGFAMILDVSSQQTPVIWASTATDVTADVIALYDKNAALMPATSPSGTNAARPGGGAGATTPRPSAPGGTAAPTGTQPRRPAAPAPTKP